MNVLLRWVIVLAAVVPVSLPVAAAGDGAERSRIAGERRDAQRRYDVAERDCQARFAVTDCLESAQRERRAVLTRLRREENLLDEAQRKQRAAERVEAIRRKVSEEAQAAPRAPKAASEPRHAPQPRARVREAAASAPAEGTSGSVPLRSGRVTVRDKPAQPGAAARAAQEQKSRSAYDERQRAAQDHLDENRRRNAERSGDKAQGKPPAAPLPVPSGAAAR